MNRRRGRLQAADQGVRSTSARRMKRREPSPRLSCPACGGAPRLPRDLRQEVRCGCGARLRLALVPVHAEKPARAPRYPNLLGRAALPPCWTKLPLPVRSRSSVTLDRSGSGSGEPLRMSRCRPAVVDRGKEREHGMGPWPRSSALWGVATWSPWPAAGGSRMRSGRRYRPGGLPGRPARAEAWGGHR